MKATVTIKCVNLWTDDAPGYSYEIEFKNARGLKQKFINLLKREAPKFDECSYKAKYHAIVTNESNGATLIDYKFALIDWI